MAKQFSTENHRDKEITREIHRLFWRANWQRPWDIVICVVCRIPAFAAIHIFMPLVVAYGLGAIINRNFDAASHYAWVLIVLALSFGVLWAIGALFIHKNGVEGGAYIQREVFSNYLSKDYDFYSNAYFGSLGAQALRLRESFNNDYNMVMLSHIPRTLTIALGSLIVIAVNSLLLAAVTLVTMGIVISFTILFGRYRLKWRREVSAANSELSGIIGDALSHAVTVKSFANEQYEQNRLTKTIAKWQHAQYVSWGFAIPGDIIRYLLVAIATAIILVMTASLYRDQLISLEIVLVIQLYVVKLIALTVDIGEIIKTYEVAMGGAYQPVKTMLIPCRVEDPTGPKLLQPGSKSITLQDVSYRYAESSKRTYAIKNVSLDIRPGEKIGLVGFSGSGKTTLTKLLLRFMDVSGGSILINGTDIRHVTQADLRNNIAYVPQEPLLFHRTIMENISFARPSAKKKDVIAAAHAAYIDEFIKELPHGFDTIVGERGVKLSGGQRQRVAIARALLKDAPILILDEATSALDSQSERFIQKALWTLMKDKTAIVVAHRLSTIQHMDRIVVVDKGRVIALGTHSELIAQKGVYADLWSHQSGGYIGIPKSMQK